METLTERLADKNKTEIAPAFIARLDLIASNEGLELETVWQKWQEYSKQCTSYDQSPVMFEFCQWNNWKVIQ